MLIIGDDRIVISWNDHEEDPNKIKYAVKNLQATCFGDPGVAIHTAFALLNQKRLQRNIDNFGQGRRLGSIEPGAVIFFTDGNNIVDDSGIKNVVFISVALILVSN